MIVWYWISFSLLLTCGLIGGIVGGFVMHANHDYNHPPIYDKDYLAGRLTLRISLVCFVLSPLAFIVIPVGGGLGLLAGLFFGFKYAFKRLETGDDSD